jgi:hypothetical protein
MNHPAEPQKPDSGDGNRFLFPFLFVVTLVAGALGLCSLLSGCSKPPARIKESETTNGAKADPWENAAKRLRKEADLPACKSALTGLNNDLTRAEKGEKPAALSSEAEVALARVVPLHATDLEEIRGATFTPHDPVYLAECLYLRDAARSISLPDLKPEELADLGFAWVCREVFLNPWLIPVDQSRFQATALAPAYVLRRGYGSGLERMYVFLSLLQQMGLDGCLIGPPGASNTLAGYVEYGADKKTVLTGAPRGPFWSVGVRIGTDVKLYDPWRGQAFPAMFSQMKAEPEKYQAWLESTTIPTGLDKENMKKATLYLAVPVNSLSPRMVLLEERLKTEVGVKLAINAPALKAAFPDPKPEFWNPPNDRFAYGRTARAFLPVEEGGQATKTDPTVAQTFRDYIYSQLPIERDITTLLANSPVSLRENGEVLEDIKQRFASFTRNIYGAAFLDPPTPRERVQRGQFQDASKALVDRQGEFGKALLRVMHTADRDKQMREWVEKAIEIYASFGRNPNAAADIDAHWRAPGAALIIDRAIGESGQAEAAYLIALCKHEQAEVLQARLEHSTGSEADSLKPGVVNAWKIALSEWYSYRDQYSSGKQGLPGLANHVMALTARAEKLSRQR